MDEGTIEVIGRILEIGIVALFAFGVYTAFAAAIA